MIQERRNEIQIDKEKKCNISSKAKKMKSHSKKHDKETVLTVNSREVNWHKWNDSAFHCDGHWANFQAVLDSHLKFFGCIIVFDNIAIQVIG